MALKTASIKAFEALSNNASLAELICTPESELYKERIAEYWSVSAQKKPHFIITPKTTEHVSQILKTITPIPDCHFAVRSGGHLAWGASNIEGGVLIDLGLHMVSVLSVDKDKVSIQPGMRWKNVYKHLEGHGVQVAGGRVASVGVAGFLTGGGISWFIPRVGWGCDQILNMEVVLADGRIVNANKDENPDLWFAMKGSSGGNFGIVTRFDLKALPDEGFWGGHIISEFDEKNTADNSAIFKRFTDTTHLNPNTSYISIHLYEPAALKKVVISNFFVNTKGIENPPELKELFELPTFVKEAGPTTPHDHAMTLEQPMGFHNNWHTTSFANDERIINKASEAHAAAIAKIKSVSKPVADGEMDRFSSLCIFQSLPLHYKALSDARGGNVVGLHQHLKGRNAISLLLTINTSDEELQPLAMQLTKEWLKEVDDYAKSLDSYLPWAYLNYAGEMQDPLAALSDIEAIKKAALKYDPEEVFQKRTPGFKITKV